MDDRSPLQKEVAGWVLLVCFGLIVMAVFWSVVSVTSEQKQERRINSFELAKLEILAGAGALPGQRSHRTTSEGSAEEVEMRPSLKYPRFIVAVGGRYLFPDGGGGHVANITIKDLPQDIRGQFMLEASDGTRAWTDEWSSDQSPTDIATFMQEHSSWDSVLRVYTRGPVTFRFTR